MLVIRQVNKVIRHFTPALFEQLAGLTDGRKRKSYEVAELVTGCISLFLFKEETRNALNNDRRELKFKENYFRLFKLRLPHMDTVEAFLRILPGKELETLKAVLVAGLIDRRVLHKYKFLGKFFSIAVDGTGVSSYNQNDADETRLEKTSKNSVKSYTYHVVEAKLVTSSGLSISIASEWVANDKGRKFQKQDCEQRAFARLAEKIKELFPKLPICILADGLYPNKTFMDICKKNRWSWILVLKDDALKTLQEDIIDTENKHRFSNEQFYIESKGKKHINVKYEWISEALSHAGHTLYWVSCTEQIVLFGKDRKRLEQEQQPVSKRFVFITDHKPDAKNIRKICAAGRMRWKIENEGFNTQKNLGFNLGHKFSRRCFGSYKNYYQCMQIAHMITQLTEHSHELVQRLDASCNLTVKHIWKQMIGYLTFMDITDEDLMLKPQYQIRLE